MFFFLRSPLNPKGGEWLAGNHLVPNFFAELYKNAHDKTSEECSTVNVYPMPQSVRAKNIQLRYHRPSRPSSSLKCVERYCYPSGEKLWSNQTLAIPVEGELNSDTMSHCPTFCSCKRLKLLLGDLRSLLPVYVLTCQAILVLGRPDNLLHGFPVASFTVPTSEYWLGLHAKVFALVNVFMFQHQLLYLGISPKTIRTRGFNWSFLPNSFKHPPSFVAGLREGTFLLDPFEYSCMRMMGSRISAVPCLFGFCPAVGVFVALAFRTNQLRSEAQSRLRQTSDLEIYIESFENLSHQVDGLPEGFLIRSFIAGLQDDIRLDVKIKRPRTLVETIGVSRLVNKRNKLLKKTSQPVAFRQR
ncbi:hypothetical protein Tco_1405229 [Tanacetum coccineum]